jgi:hypothetical protein
MTDTRMTGNITRDKAIVELEKLKVNISLVEAQYQVLGHDFSRLCDEILADVKTSGEEKSTAPANNESSIPVVLTEEITSSVDLNDISKIDEMIAAEPVIASIPVNTPDSSPKIYQSSINDIINNYANHHKQDNYQVVSRQITDKKIIDKIADGIETGLDRLGDGLMYPVVKMVSLIQHLIKTK